MMNQHEQEVRLAAEEAFEKSLHQLEERLLSDEGRPPLKAGLTTHRGRNLSLHQTNPTNISTPAAPQASHSSSSVEADLQAFAEAAEEIEQFIQARR